jgi:hypothetical protein
MSKKNKSIINGKYYPLVSICTPTFNRRPFIPTMVQCFLNQTYPRHRMEWIIVDDGTDKIRNILESFNIPEIKYYELPEKVPLGEKRNIMHKYATGNIIVYMDDDDYYPPERVEHAVERLTSDKKALCAGSSEIYIYFKHIQKMYQCGPYGPNHATAGTFAFKRELLEQTKYDSTAELAEEKSFLKNYTVPFVQLDPMKTILVFSHNHNTFDKKRLLENPHPDFCKESPKTVDMFIRQSKEKPIKMFFLQYIDHILENYKPGEPSMKPGVLEQIKKLEKEREELARQAAMNQNMNANQPIMMQKPDGTVAPLSTQDVLQIIQQQQQELQKKQQEIETLNKKLLVQNNIINNMKAQLYANQKPSENDSSVRPVFGPPPPPTSTVTGVIPPNIFKKDSPVTTKPNTVSKLTPQVMVSVSD